MNETVTISIEEITPEIAEQYLKNNYKNNRPLKQVSVSQFASDMSDGSFILNPSAPLIFSKSGELIDGQHRLRACVQSGCSFKSFVVRGADEKTYEVIDIGNPRSVSDIVGGEYKVELQSLARATLATKNGTSGISMSMRGVLNQPRRDGKKINEVVSKPATVNEIKANRKNLVECARVGKRMGSVVRKWGVTPYSYFQWLVRWVGKDDLIEEFTEEFCSVDSMNVAITTGRTLLLQRATKKNVLTPHAWVVGAMLTIYDAYLQSKQVKSFKGVYNTIDTWSELVYEKRKTLNGENNG